MVEVFALMRQEPRYNVVMLDVNPIEAARQHCDEHVRKFVTVYAQMLSAAWQIPHNPWRMGGRNNPPGKEFFKWVVPPAMRRAPELTAEQADGPVHTGDKPVTLLMGQRIPAFTYDMGEDPAIAWLMQSEGNYRWLWQCAMELINEHERRFGYKPESTKFIWTLEFCPPSLAPADTVPGTFISPEMAEYYKVIDEDGFYDTISSYRNWYTEGRQELLNWAKSKEPPWVEYVGGEYKLKGESK